MKYGASSIELLENLAVTVIKYFNFQKRIENGRIVTVHDIDE